MPNTTTPPIGFFIFNRPIETARAFATIREARPTQLFVIADGPRNEADVPLCEAARAVINVDWPCELHTNYSEKNLGCGQRPSTGITWMFEHVERAIILEDDCIPDQSFFRYAGELLEKYESDERVMHIAGSSFASFLPNAFGCWATWRRAWKYYDYYVTTWPALRDSGALINLFHNRGGYEKFALAWDKYYAREITDSWDGQWSFACMSRGAISLTPKVNLVKNIGYNERGTHTKEENQQARMPVRAMPFPLIHPATLVINREADNYMLRFHYGIDRKLRYRMVRPFKNYFPNLYGKLKRLLKK